MAKFFIAFIAAAILLVFLQAAFPALAQETTPSDATELQAQTTTQSQSACGTNYTVLSGDTMGQIAVKCGVTYTALRAANPQIVNPDLIFPGQVLAIPTGGPIPPTGSTRYTVVAGDRLFAIAQRYNTTVAAIQAANPFITNPNLIYPGQVLIIPTGGSIPPTGGQNYTVRAGDTLSNIGVRFNRTVNQLLAANTWITNADLIYPGQVVRIP